MSKRKWYSLLYPALIIVILLSSCGGTGETFSPSSTSDSPEPTAFTRAETVFSELPYTRPEPDELRAVILAFIADMESADSAQKQIALMTAYDREMRRYSDMASIARIRFSQTTSEEDRTGYTYFAGLFAELLPEMNQAEQTILHSKYIEDLEARFGAEAIEQFRISVREYDPGHAALLVTLTALETEYTQLAASYDQPTMGFINQANDIFDEMRPLREEMARLAGYDSFSEYSYSSWSVDLAEVETFIGDVKEALLPVFQKLADSTDDRCPAVQMVLPVYVRDEAALADLSLRMLEAALEDMNPLIDYMERNELLDLMPREGKENGAFTAPLYGEQIPFVFMDYPYPDTIFHEFGHALEVYSWPEIDIMERFAITPESMEVSSMGMEVLATEVYEMLYGDTAEYAKMAKTYEWTATLLMTAMQCEFELALYAGPDMTLTERNNLFNALSEEYRLDVYPWATVQHFFVSPLYTVGYALDTVAALELWRILQENPAEAKDAYLAYLQDCNEKDFAKRLQNAGYQDPLEKETLTELADWLDGWFSSDDYLYPEPLPQAG